MSSLNFWMPLWVQDYLKDTTTLSAEEHGIYLLLLMEYWQSGPLESDFKKLCRLVRAFEKSEQNSLQNIIKKYFHEAAGFLHNKRSDIELSKRKNISQMRRFAANQRHKENANGLQNENENENHPHANAPANAPANVSANDLANDLANVSANVSANDLPITNTNTNTSTNTTTETNMYRTHPGGFPSMAEIQEFCVLNHLDYGVGLKFFSHYEKKSWKTKGKRIENWKGLLIKWHNGDLVKKSAETAQMGAVLTSSEASAWI